MAIEKLNMKFVPEQILQDEDMTKIVNKVDEVVDKVNESVSVYNKNGFYISKTYLEAYALRYIGFKDIVNDDTCYLLTAGRCLKFSLTTFEVFWDVEIAGYGTTWHIALEQLRIIDEVVYILGANYNIRNSGIELIKLNDTDGSFISKEEIPLKVVYNHEIYYNKSCLITKDFIAGRNDIDKTVEKVNLIDNSVEVIAPALSVIYINNLWITNPNGEVKNAIVWLKESNVICVYDEDGVLYTINLQFKSGINFSTTSNKGYYSFNFNTKRIVIRSDDDIYNIKINDDNDNNYSATDIAPKKKQTTLNYNNEKYNNSLANVSFNHSKFLFDLTNSLFLDKRVYKDLYFVSNLIKGQIFLDANCCSTPFYPCKIEISDFIIL